FHGGTVPQSDAVVVDMSGMDRIVRMDRRNKVALIEPGVRFDSLCIKADELGLKVLMPLLPRSGKSVIGCYLEREPIQIPKYHWDMTDPMLCTELVFGTGDLFRTGSAGSPGTLEQQWAANNMQKNPLGPGQTDFLRIVQGSQGTMAAVMWCTVKLEVKPSIHRIYFVPGDKLSNLVDFTYKSLKSKLADEFFILNSQALSTIISGDRGEIAGIAGKQSSYTVVYGVSGYDCLPEDRVAYQEKDIENIAQDTGVKARREIPGCSAAAMEKILAAPSPDPYYKTGPKGAFADIFFLTTLDRTESFIDVMNQVALEHGYPSEEIGIYIQPIQHGRTVHLEFTIYYDPSEKRKVSEIKNLYEDAGSRLFKAGAFFSRPYNDWADLAYSKCPDTVGALRKVKGILDPEGILNRGKLCFKEVE
ncbi:MAG: FAD-binding oxidoreductase, partial [Actinobacteria bacterium]|nr:FAD-binding oxidoreductase [Actinomycetota bacterium]